MTDQTEGSQRASADEKATPQAWVGCLACYNAGRLVGAWMDGTDADDRELFEAAVQDLGDGLPPERHSLAHEELQVMDHEGYGGLLKGECSPTEAARLADVLERIEADGYPVEAVAAWRDHVGASHADLEDLGDFEEIYCGEYDSEADYAEELAGEFADFKDLAEWPLSCIDWQHAWRELEVGGDNWSCDAPGGLVYVFRSA